MSEPTGNEVADHFLAELDARIEGARGTPPDSAARLQVMRPIIRAAVIQDPEKFAEFAAAWFENNPD